MKLFENRRLKGAVSIFLVIITIPCLLLSAVLIDGSRLSSARAMTQEATDLAAASILASYDQTLKDEFGLFAMEEKDPAALEEIFKESLNATLLAHGMTADSDYSERLWDIMKTTVTGEKSYMGESFLNLYDFSLDSCQVTPLYSLANQDVLENQMVEYAKFRGIYVMADRLELFRQTGEIQAEAEKNKVSSEVMEDKMDVDEENAAADAALKKLQEEIPGLNDGIRAVETAEERYLTCLRARMEQLRIQNTDTEDTLTREQREDVRDYEAARTALLDAASETRTQAETVLDRAEKARSAINASIGRLEKFRNSNQGKAAGNETVQELLKDADDNIKKYRESYLPSVEGLLKDSTLTRLAGDTGLTRRLEGVMDEIGEAVTAYTDEISRMLEEAGETDIVILEYFYYFLDSRQNTASISEAVSGGSGTRYYRPALREPSDYFRGKSWDPEDFNPAKKNSPTSDSSISQDFAKNTSGAAGDPDKGAEGEAERGTIDDAVYNARPSRTFDPEAEKSVSTAFYNESNDLSASKNAVSKGSDSFLLGIGEAARDDILAFSYMIGTFKTRLTGVEKFSASGMSQKDKDSFYMPKWRYAHGDGELDMRFEPKKDRNTVLRSEIEYIIYGNKSDAANEAAVYSTIFAERLANNMIAMYTEWDVVNPSCHAAAALASAATGGLVPEPVFFWIFLTAWATAETVIEMDYLISGGYKIPLFKTNRNILLNKIPTASGDGLISNYGTTGIFVSYEDYLTLFMLMAGKEKRIMRSADLIEMNMKKNGETDFTMAEAYTYLRAESGLSIRLLFGSVMPFQETYESQGYSGRIRFTNTIYQGY